jgi:hypothetical protein
MTLNSASSAEKKTWAEQVSAALEDQIAASDRIVISAGETD